MTLCPEQIGLLLERLGFASGVDCPLGFGQAALRFPKLLFKRGHNLSDLGFAAGFLPDSIVPRHQRRRQSREDLTLRILGGRDNLRNVSLSDQFDGCSRIYGFAQVFDDACELRPTGLRRVICIAPSGHNVIRQERVHSPQSPAHKLTQRVIGPLRPLAHIPWKIDRPPVDQRRRVGRHEWLSNDLLRSLPLGLQNGAILGIGHPDIARLADPPDPQGYPLRSCLLGAQEIGSHETVGMRQDQPRESRPFEPVEPLSGSEQLESVKFALLVRPEECLAVSAHTDHDKSLSPSRPQREEHSPRRRVVPQVIYNGANEF